MHLYEIVVIIVGGAAIDSYNRKKPAAEVNISNTECVTKRDITRGCC